MRALTGGLLILLSCAAPLLGQERDRSLERIRLELQQPLPPVRVDADEITAPKTFGIFTLMPPTGRGEMIRVSIPIGELVSRAFKGAAAAHRKRNEAAARRQVEAELEWFKAQLLSRKQAMQR